MKKITIFILFRHFFFKFLGLLCPIEASESKSFRQGRDALKCFYTITIEGTYVRETCIETIFSKAGQENIQKNKIGRMIKICLIYLINLRCRWEQNNLYWYRRNKIIRFSKKNFRRLLNRAAQYEGFYSFLSSLIFLITHFLMVYYHNYLLSSLFDFFTFFYYYIIWRSSLISYVYFNSYN